jgi:hypothetical protein
MDNLSCANAWRNIDLWQLPIVRLIRLFRAYLSGCNKAGNFHAFPEFLTITEVCPRSS